MIQQTPEQEKMLQDKRNWLIRHRSELRELRRDILEASVEKIHELVIKLGDGTAWPRDDIMRVIEETADELSRYRLEL